MSSIYCQDISEVVSNDTSINKYHILWLLNNTLGYENIARGNVTALDAYNAWYNSPGHYANMFNPDFKVIGIGYIQLPGSKFTHYWTTDFGV